MLGRVEKTILEDIAYVAPRLRDQDRDEIKATSGRSPYAVLKVGLRESLYCFTVRQKQTLEPVGIFGLSEIKAWNVGVPWMLATDNLKLVARSFLRAYPHWLNLFHREYDLLMNYVDVRNTLSIRWLKAAGFTFLREVPYGCLQLPFYEFVRLKYV